MLTENKFSKYLIYAIGEIVLVVIGILIALSINNWNETKKISNSETNYLNVLKLEFEKNQEKLQSAIKTNENNLKSGRELSDLMSNDSTNVTLARLRSLILGVVNSEVQYRPNNGVINEIINSGKLEIFKDDSLRFMISSWDGQLLRVKFQEQEELNVARQNMFNIIFEKTNVKNMLLEFNDNMFLLRKSEIKSDEFGLLKSLRFENALSRFIASSHYMDFVYRNIYKFQEELIEKTNDI
ncbi:hypothetical protein OE09_2049 [Flavobacteriaceae bacterium MAR_2010_72]|nr:hypothetical protein OE09_2049 [Flavobacteriaceae bacterium MAR_2010_72]